MCRTPTRSPSSAERAGSWGTPALLKTPTTRTSANFCLGGSGWVVPSRRHSGRACLFLDASFFCMRGIPGSWVCACRAGPVV